MTVPSRGWYVEVDAPSTGHTWTPSLLDDPQWQPAINGLPKVTVGVEKSPKWTEPEFDGAPMRVWYDGTRLPIDEVESAKESPEKVTLVGVGGVELREPAEIEYGRGQPVDDAVRNLIQTETSYGADVDTPPTETFSGVDIQQLTSESEWRRARLGQFPEDEPVALTSNGGVKLLAAGNLTEAENAGTPDTTVVSDPAASQGEALRLSDDGDTNASTVPDKADGSFSIPYRWNEPVVAIRWAADNTSPQLELRVDDTQIASYDAGAVPFAYEWQTELAQIELGALEPGSHDFTLRVVEDSGADEADIDIIYVYDTSEINPTFDNDVDAGDRNLQGPELYPDSRQVTLAEGESLHAVEFAECSIAIDDTSNAQAIEISGDGGQTWDKQSNTATHTGVSFGSPQVSAKVRLTLSRYDDGRNATPDQGNSGQTVSELTLTADQVDLPFVIREDYDTRLADIVNELASRGDFVWEVRWDESAGHPQIAFTQSGQRTTDDDPGIATYEYERSTASLVTKATVYGHTRQSNGETFTANHGTAVSLRHAPMVSTREEVYDPNTDQVFSAPQDYTIDVRSGELTTQSSGRMTDGETYQIDYEYRISGQYDSGAADVRAETVDIPALTTIRGCRQAAYIITDELQTPQQPTTVTIPRTDPGWSIIEAIDLAQIPGGALSIDDSESNEQETVLRLDNKKTLRDIQQEIRERVSSISRKV